MADQKTRSLTDDEKALIAQQKSERRTQIYKSSLESISNYFGVSEMCALYLFHRSFRSKRTDDKHLPWTVQLQNALVKVDKCSANWDQIYFNYEETVLNAHGVILEEMSGSKVFRWPEEEVRIANAKRKANTIPDDDGWTTVTKKTRVRKPKANFNISLVRRSGLFI